MRSYSWTAKGWRLLLQSAAVRVLSLAAYFRALPVQAGQNQQGGTGPAVRSNPAAAPESGNSESPLPLTLTLQSGTLITVRVSQSLSTDQSQPGDVFDAELYQPLVVDGWVVARRGQTLLGRVAFSQKAGRVKGVSRLGLELNQLVLVDGQQSQVWTQVLRFSGGTSRDRDAEMVGATTGIGAAVGAAAQGGEGAGIGAGLGGAAGVASVLLTRGRSVEIPPETLLTFQLKSPVTISTERSQAAFRPVTQADYDNQGRLGRRPQRAAEPPPPSLFYFGGYGPWDPWGYYFPGPFFGGFYSFGPEFGRRGLRR
jgi:hypothetical protein